MGGRMGRRALLGMVVGATSMAVGAQTSAPVDTVNPIVNPVALVRHAMQLRLQQEKHHRLVRYVLCKRDGDHETTKAIVETADGDVARLIAINGKPLNADQEKVEMNRLDALMEQPALQQKRHSAEERDAARLDELVEMLPDSEIYRLEGIVPCGAGQCYRMSFVPNPAFTPPTFEADVLKGFAGEILIDKAQDRLVRLDAHLVREVNIGFGILGRLDKGGTMHLEQEYESDVRQWQPTTLTMNLTGRALMVKPVKIQIDEFASGFEPVPAGTGYREGIAMLKKQGVGGAQR